MTATETLTAVPAWLAVAAAAAVAASLAVAGLILRRIRRGLPLIVPTPNRPVPWEGNDVALVVLVYFAAAGLAASASGPNPGVEPLLAVNVAINAAVTLLAIAWLRLRGADWFDLGLAPLRVPRDLALAVAGWAFVLAPLLALAAALNSLVAYDHPVVSLLTQDRSLRAVGTVVAAAVVAAPIAEELFFRRILLGWLDARLPSAGGSAAIVVSAAAFALAHQGQGLAFVPLFPLGIVLGFIAHRTGSIVPCILLHAFFNAVSVALLVADSGTAAAAG